MTKFDFKKWVTEHKHGKKPLFEQERRRPNKSGGRVSPTIDPQDNSMVAPPSSCALNGYSLADCFVFTKCINGVDDNDPKIYGYGGGSANPGVFWSMVGSPANPGDVVEITSGVNMGDKFIFQGNDDSIDIYPIPANPGGPSTCTAPLVIDGCTDMNATNFDPTATNDDGTCFYGYNCRKQNTPQDIGFKKGGGGDLGIDPNKVKSIREWVGIGMCYEAAAGTTGTFPDLASCRNSCGPIAWEEPWEKMPV